jgi:hypothetical protein
VKLGEHFHEGASFGERGDSFSSNISKVIVSDIIKR